MFTYTITNRGHRTDPWGTVVLMLWCCYCYASVLRWRHYLLLRCWFILLCWYEYTFVMFVPLCCYYYWCYVVKIILPCCCFIIILCSCVVGVFSCCHCTVLCLCRVVFLLLPCRVCCIFLFCSSPDIGTVYHLPKVSRVSLPNCLVRMQYFHTQSTCKIR